MQYMWQYIFCLLLVGFLGLGIGYYSRDQEVSILREWLRTVPAVIEKPLVVLQVASTSIASPPENDLKISVDSVPIDTDHMKQIAHVPMPEDRLPDVSMSFSYAGAYVADLQYVSNILKSINHDEQEVRMRARLELAQISIAGPMGKYIQHLVTSLLVRFCKDDGALCSFDDDPAIEHDLEKAIALLEKEMENTEGFEQFARADFTPVQRRVQRNAYNEKLRSLHSPKDSVGMNEISRIATR